MKLLKTLVVYFLIGSLLLSCDKIKSESEASEINKEAVIKDTVQDIPNQKLTSDQQIASALFAAPQEVRNGATVYGYDDENNFITLREGTNEMICIADNPEKDGFEVVSYHTDLEPYMARGRVLKTEGKSFTERRDIREEEAKEGLLKMPKKPATLHILYGEKGWFDIDSTKIRNAKYRYVVYIPFATQASTGLSLKPNAPGHPWLMFPGKANAHIMITPQTNENKKNYIKI